MVQVHLINQDAAAWSSDLVALMHRSACVSFLGASSCLRSVLALRSAAASV